MINQEHHNKHRIILSIESGAYDCMYCELNIPKSNWLKIQNGATCSFLGIGKYEGEKFQSEWYFDKKNVFITGDFGGGSYFNGTIEEISHVLI